MTLTGCSFLILIPLLPAGAYELPDPCEAVTPCFDECNTSCENDYGDDYDCAPWCLDGCQFCFDDRVWYVDDLMFDAYDKKDAIDMECWEVEESKKFGNKKKVEPMIEECHERSNEAQSEIEFYEDESKVANKEARDAKVERQNIESQIMMEEYLNQPVPTYESKPIEVDYGAYGKMYDVDSADPYGLYGVPSNSTGQYNPYAAYGM